MTAEQTEKLSAAYVARGYLVIARMFPIEIGSIIRNFGWRHELIQAPMRVVAETTREDLAAQLRLWRDDSEKIDPDYVLFYRVEGD